MDPKIEKKIARDMKRNALITLIIGIVVVFLIFIQLAFQVEYGTIQKEIIFTISLFFIVMFLIIMLFTKKLSIFYLNWQIKMYSIYRKIGLELITPKKEMTNTKSWQYEMLQAWKRAFFILSLEAIIINLYVLIKAIQM